MINQEHFRMVLMPFSLDIQTMLIDSQEILPRKIYGKQERKIANNLSSDIRRCQMSTNAVIEQKCLFTYFQFDDTRKNEKLKWKTNFAHERFL